MRSCDLLYIHMNLDMLLRISYIGLHRVKIVYESQLTVCVYFLAWARELLTLHENMVYSYPTQLQLTISPMLCTVYPAQHVPRSNWPLAPKSH